MATLAYSILTVNGISVNTAQYKTYFEDARPGPHNKRQTLSPVDAVITGKAPGFVRSQPQPETWEVTIKLTATDETDIQAMNAIWVAGSAVYLRANDGQAVPVPWRIVIVPLSAPQRVQGSKSLFFVPVHLPDPTWEQDTLNTDTKSNQTVSPIAMGTAGVTNNAGTRDCDAKITITADVAKSENSALNDWPYSFESIWVNRAPRALDNEPVYLMDQSGAAARIATGTAASGAVVRRTTSATTLTADPGAAGTTIAVTSAAAFNANGGLAVIAWVTGSTFGTMEEIYYTGVSGLNLTGCVRGVGGTTAQAHAIGTAIAASGTMPNGDDVAVWLDGSRLDTRYLVAWNSTASDIVVNMTAPPVLALTATAAATATVPAVGDVLRFVEGNGSLAAAGHLTWGNEVFHYSVKSGDDGVTIDGRALWGTTAATHATSALVYANPHRVTVGMGWAKAPPAYAPLATRPCIQLPGSSNLVQKWGDESDDANTAYYDPLNPERPKMWTPGFDKDGNTVSPLMSLSAYGTIATFKDDVSGDGSPPRNYLEIAVAQGIDAGNANAIINDWTPRIEILNLELFTRDSGGVWKLQDQLQAANTAADNVVVAARALPAGLAATAYAVKLKGRYAPVTGVYVNASGQYATDAGAGAYYATAQKIVFTAPFRITRVLLRLKLSTGSTPLACNPFLFGDTSGLPDNTQILAQFGSMSVISATDFWYVLAVKPFVVPAGAYWLVENRGAGAVDIHWMLTSGNTGKYLTGRLARSTGAAWTIAADYQAAGFYIDGTYVNDGTAVIQDDQPALTDAGARTGTTASFDKTILTLEPLQTVYVHRLTAPVTNGGTGALFHGQCVVANATNGDSLSIDRWMMPTATLAIDTKAGTVNYTEAGIAYPVLASLGAVPQLRLAPGNNTITVTDASLIAPGQMDAVLEWRGARS